MVMMLMMMMTKAKVAQYQIVVAFGNDAIGIGSIFQTHEQIEY